MHCLKQSTAASVIVGPVLDSTGAAYTGALIGDFNLTKNGTSAALAAAATATHDHNGHYIIALTTGNTDTLGRMAITCNKATYAMSMGRFEVLTAAVFDVLVTNVLSAARALDTVADTSLTLNDALHCAVAGAVGKETIVGTAYTIKTPSTGTVIRTFVLDSTTAPTSRS